MNFDDKLELIRSVVERGGEFIALNNAVANSNNELEHVLTFNVDPVDNVRWDEFVSNF